ncbi:EAL domain-containing protein [Starkeya koreensis]|uniref:EAL domain-containing protein n=1 Tax=Ancylobacter koreensis TaxID=266121 RepID=A0ABT0DHI0_9HYPH|nr:EAL domain-containing protein [Ancylobacter koreensis]MCK0206664.1 EAL domain-containing protein [Ancylobacter koreensis]
MSADAVRHSVRVLADGLERNLLLLVLAALIIALCGNVLRAMPPLRRALAGGTLVGGTAAASLFFPIWESGAELFDLKIVPLTLAAPIFGPLAALLAGAIALGARAMAHSFAVPCVIGVGGAVAAGTLVAGRLGWRLDPRRVAARPLTAGHAVVLALLALLVAGATYGYRYGETSLTGEGALAPFLFIVLAAPAVTLVFALLYAFDEQQRHTRLTLAATQARLSTIGNNLPGVLYQRATGPNGELVFTYVSARAKDVLGVPAEELVANPARLLELVHPDDIHIVRAAMAQARRGGAEALENEYRIIRPDGEVRWLHVRSQRTHRDQLSADHGMVAEGIAFDVTAQKEAEQAAQEARQRHEWLLSHDMMTGLLNRHALLQMIDAHLASPAPGAALLLIDLSQSALVNEFFGAEAGDERLKEAASRLAAITPGGAAVARTGGDSFAVFVPASDREAARRLAMRIAAVMATPLVRDGQDMPMAARVGISYGPEQGADGQGLVRAASVALESARDAPDRVVAEFTPDMARLRAEQRHYDEELRRAVTGGELTLVYQPVVRTDGRILVGFEALVRWNHPVFGDVPAGEFVARAEATGLWAALDRFVLLRACTEARHWAGEPWLSVNLSAAWFQIGDVVAAIRQVLDATGFPARRLQVEVTERILIERYDAAIRIIDGLHDLGVAVSIDDFGTFYSSLGYLHRLPIDKIKLDRSFALDVDHSERAQAVVESVLALCARLRIEVVAEGVETEAQYAWLAAHGCPLVQGFLTGHPGPAPAGERDADKRTA